MKIEALVTESRHAETVASVCASYAAIPDGATVRLVKRTSNLFRLRTAEPVAGLDVSGLNGVIAIDRIARTADVQGMCTYETLVAATLPHGLMPKVVPQLRTITVGGAVSGLGIESSSFRYGLPHESVVEIDVLTGAGEIVTASRSERSDLFRAFPNSYGSLGYAVRLRIELVPTKPYVALRHLRFDSPAATADAIARICAERVWDGESVEFLDGVVFDPTQCYLSLGRFVDQPVGVPSDYTRQRIYYRSIQQRERDCLTVENYLWRWDTDWFWCSAAFGAQIPWVRRVWPRRWRRSDVYHRLIALDQRLGIGTRLDRRRGSGSGAGRPGRGGPGRADRRLSRLVPRQCRYESGVAVPCAPERARRPAVAVVSVEIWPGVRERGVLGNRGDGLRRDAHGEVNRSVERAVAEHGGHESLYSDAFYDRDTFDALYGGDALRVVKASYDPEDRLTGLYEKAVRRR